MKERTGRTANTARRAADTLDHRHAHRAMNQLPSSGVARWQLRSPSLSTDKPTVSRSCHAPHARAASRSCHAPAPHARAARPRRTPAAPHARDRLHRANHRIDSPPSPRRRVLAAAPPSSWSIPVVVSSLVARCRRGRNFAVFRGQTAVCRRRSKFELLCTERCSETLISCPFFGQKTQKNRILETGPFALSGGNLRT